MSIILLDIGNVLVSVDFLAFCTGVLPRSAQLCGVGEQSAVFDKYCQGTLKSCFDRGVIPPSDYLAMIASDPLTARLSAGEIIELWQQIFSPIAGAPEGVEMLEREHRIWIMSDTDPLHFAFLLQHCMPLRNRERYLLSYEHGFLKSEPEAFLHLLRATGIAAREFLLIDDKAENCSAAAEAGIASVRFVSWPETLAAVAALCNRDGEDAHG